MIIGNGMLASCFKKYDREDIIYFCSGVSDSKTTDINQFLREQKLLLTMPRNRPIVYTSTLSVAIGKTAYQLHKTNMEKLIQINFTKHLIFRVGNLVGEGQKPYQFFPSIINQIKSGTIQVQNCCRDLLDVTLYVAIVNGFLDMPKFGLFKLCATKQPTVTEIVKKIETRLGIECKKEIIPCNEPNIFIPDYFSGGDAYYIDVINRYIW